jgi:serine/threonine-protein kinase
MTGRHVVGGAMAWAAGAVASITVSMLALSTIGVESAGALPVGPQPVVPGGPPAMAVSPPASVRPSPSPSASASRGPGAHVSTGSPPSVPSSPASEPSSPVSVQRQFDADSGAFSARCTGDVAYLLSWSPAPGYTAAGVQRGPAAVVRVSFVGTARTNTFRVRCVGGVPHVSDGDE